MNMTEDISDTEYLDDPIGLFHSEHRRVYNAELNGNSEDLEETIEIYDSGTECKNTEFPHHKPQFILPAAFFDKERNVELLSQCRPLSIRLIDCKKHLSKCTVKDNLNEFEIVQNNENKKNNTSKLESTLFTQCDVKQVSGTTNKFHIDESSNENTPKNSKRNLGSLEKYIRNVDKTYEKLKALVDMPTNTTNIHANCYSNTNTVNLNARNATHSKFNICTAEEITVKSKCEYFIKNLKQITNQLKNSNVKNTKTITSKTSVKRKTTDDNEKILEKKRKEACGSHSPIMPRLLKPVNCVKGNVSACNKIKFAQSKINHMPSLSLNIYRDNKNMNGNKNISTFNNSSMNILPMPCCLNAFLQNWTCTMRTNNDKNRKVKEKKMTAEENTTQKKRLYDASVKRIPDEISSKFTYMKSCPVQLFSSSAKNPLPKKNTEPQKRLRPIVNTHQIQNTCRNFNNYGTVIRTDTGKPSIVTRKNKERDDQKLEAIQKRSKESNKSQILYKKPILIRRLQQSPAEMTTPNITQGNHLSGKGYSPAVLPIPTFQNTLNDIIKLQCDFKRLHNWKSSHF